MKLRNALIVVLLVSVLALVLLPLAAYASPPPMTGGMHSCTQTSPRYLLTDDNAAVTTTPDSYKFSASSYTMDWVDAYLMEGYSRGVNSADSCGTYRLPVAMADHPKIVSSLTSTWSGYYARPGWDVWLVRAGTQDQETTNTLMQADPRTVELLIQPGYPYGHSYTANPGWYRIFANAGNLKNVNITAIINHSLRQDGLRPSDYDVASIGGGAEFAGATFRLTGYNLSITMPPPLRTRASIRLP